MALVANYANCLNNSANKQQVHCTNQKCQSHNKEGSQLLYLMEMSQSYGHFHKPTKNRQTEKIGRQMRRTQVAYATALDVFVIMCFMAVFTALIEFAFINFLDMFIRCATNIFQWEQCFSKSFLQKIEASRSCEGAGKIKAFLGPSLIVYFGTFP